MEKTFTNLIDYVYHCFKNKLKYSKEELRPLVERALKMRISKASNLDYLTEVSISVDAEIFNSPQYRASPKAQEQIINEVVDELYSKRLEQIKRDAKIYKERSK